MDLLLPLGFFCFGPLLLFGAGWLSCYYLMVKYRLRFDRREDFDEIPTNNRRISSKPAWEP
jgi:hypothetical protein